MECLFHRNGRPLATGLANIDYLHVLQLLLVLEEIILAEWIFSPQLMLRVDGLCRFYA